MLPDETGNKKDIRQRAEEFLNYGVLGCCPDVKAALGKTVADANAPKQPEKALPGVENHNGRRFDPNAKWEPGMELHLFPTRKSQSDVHGQPNFGWIPSDGSVPENNNQEMVEALRRLANKPRVVSEVWEVDEQGNPTKKVSSSDKNENTKDEIEEKGLGRTLREMNPGGTLVARAAKKFGVWVDDLGKFRCPPGTPQANQFTDEFGSTCFAVSAGQLINAAQEGFASLGDRWKKWRQRRPPFFIDEFGNVTENVDIIEGRQEYKRVFTGSRARVRARMIELEQNVADLLKLHGIKETPGSNYDLGQLIAKLAPDMDLRIMNPDFVWDNLDASSKRRLAQMGITKQSLVDTERGFLLKIAEMAITDPDRLSRIGRVRMNPKTSNEGFTSVLGSDDVTDTRYDISYNPIVMAENVVTQLPEVERNQRLGLRVEGAASDEEAADALHKFVVNENQWAGGMSASLGKNPFLTKGAHTAMHEVAHSLQIDKLIDVIVERHGSSAKWSDFTSGSLFDLMKNYDDGLDMDDLGLVYSDLEKVAFLGGQYGAEEFGRTGSVSELWKIEATAELYALREMGVIEGDDVDAALTFMDDIGATKTSKMREAAKKKNIKRIERDATKPVARPDGRPDTPDSPPPRKPRKARPVKSAAAADGMGKRMRTSALEKLDSDEVKAVERLGDPRDHSVTSLVDPEQSLNAVLSIDSNHKLARKHGADLDEVDVSESKAVERVAYDQKRKRLYVTYKGRDGEPGRTYYYRKVEPETVLELHKAEKKGTAINEIKKTHEFVKVDKVPEKIDKTSLDDGDIASQVQFNLIPTLTALDKSEVGREMRVVVTVDKGKRGGEIAEIRGLTTARIFHDGISLKDDEVVLSLPADARGIPVVAGEFDRELTGSTTLMMMPPMKIAVLDDKDGRRAELVDQESSSTTLTRMLDEWPAGSDAKEGKTVNSARIKTEEVVAMHLAMGEGDGTAADGSTTPISARRIRTRNADIHERQKRRKGSPTKPTKEYRDSVGTTRFGKSGKIETPEERRMSRTFGLAATTSRIRNNPAIDPEVARVLSGLDDRQVSMLVDEVARAFHENVDRRPRLRVSEDELKKLISDGGRSYRDMGFASSGEKAYQATMGIHPDTDDIDRPVLGYVVHPAQDTAARNAMRRSGKQVGDSPMEWPAGLNPHGDVDADGDIEILLKPEVSGRTAYGFGYGMDNGTRPVWLNSGNPSDIADALVHVDPEGDPEGSDMRLMNALSASIDEDFGYFTDVSSVKPAATTQNETTQDFIKRTTEHAKASKPQRLGAHIMGGFVNEEIAEVRLPWSSVSKSSSDMDISDVVRKEPISDRLRRLGFTDAEIEYFYTVNGDRSLDYISSATMGSLREYRKAMQVKREYEKMGIPSVSFMHPAGMDPLDISSYSPNPTPGMTVERALEKAINQEVDALLEKMLKQVRKTRGKIWEMNPKAGVPA